MDPNLAADLDAAAHLVADAKRPVVLTGAGISVAAGLPTYRGDGGLWDTNPDAEARSTPPPAKMCDPDERRAWWDRMWHMWGPLRGAVDAAGPTAAHHAIAQWEQRVEQLTVVTQNIDGLHQAAGSTNVVELHGTLFTNRCSKRRCSQQRWADRTVRTDAPDCPKCGRPARLDVVLFGEQLDRNNTAAANRAIDTADLVVVIGTSGNVWPAAEMPAAAAYDGTPTLRIDPGPWRGPHLNWTVQLESTADDAFALLDARHAER